MMSPIFTSSIVDLISSLSFFTKNINNFIMYDMLENRNRNIDRDKLFDYRRRIERDSIKSEQIKFKFNKYT